MRRRFAIHARSIVTAMFLTLTALALTAASVFADGAGPGMP